MIFVIVGTHEQQFNRLIEYMDNWAVHHDEDVFIQTGFSTYKPKHCMSQDFLPREIFDKKISEARIIITHGGPSSFIESLQIGKTPIVVPRQNRFREHINDHQVDFCKKYEQRMGNIIIVQDIDKLGDAIASYDEIVAGLVNRYKSNNNKFCIEFSKIVDDMFK